MNIRAIYTKDSLSILRRVKAPLSELANRGHAFSFIQVPSFSSGLSFGADITILPNWILNDEEYADLQRLSHERIFVYDLSVPALLHSDDVRRVLSCCKLVTVPNEYLKKEVSLIHSNVAVTSSCIDVPSFVVANRRPKPKNTVIGCFGPYDWKQVKDVLVELQIPCIGGREAKKVLGNLVEEVSLETDQYPFQLHNCAFGLAPQDGSSGIDDIWSLEYGILCLPVIGFPQSVGKDTWKNRIEELLHDPKIRAKKGHDYFDRAYLHRAPELAGQYLKVYRKKLPQVILA